MRAAAVACALAVSATATADTPLDDASAIEVDRAASPAGRIELGFDGGAPVEGWGVTATGGWLERPIRLTLADGTEILPVRRRETVGLGGALALGDAIVVDARLAAARQIGDRLRGTGDDARLDRYVLGDLGIGARIRVHARGAIAVFVRGELSLPTGNQHELAGEAGTTVAWRLIGRFALARGIVAAASAGLRLRGTEVVVGDRLIGNEALGNAGIAIPIPPIHPLWCVADQVRLTGEVAAVLGDNVGNLGRGPSPVEARLGVVTRPLPAWTIGVRVGAGLTDEIGSPRWRATIELGYRGDWKLIPPRDQDAEAIE